jgi:hypothetical protein
MRLLTWDWREQIDFERLAKVLTELTDGNVHLREAVTHDDQFAIVLSTEPITQAEADERYRRYYLHGYEPTEISYDGS